MSTAEEGGMVNAYVCPDGHTTWTINADAGAAPFVTPCPEPGCEAEATSECYKVPQDTPTTHEWYRPILAEYLGEAERRYVEQGGLLLRRTIPLRWTHPTNPTEARVAPDGRIALRVHIAVNARDNHSKQRWYVASTPNGQFTVDLLTDEDVADWTPLPLDGKPKPEGQTSP